MQNKPSSQSLAAAFPSAPLSWISVRVKLLFPVMDFFVYMFLDEVNFLESMKPKHESENPLGHQPP